METPRRRMSDFELRLRRATRAVRAALDAEAKEPVRERRDIAIGAGDIWRPRHAVARRPNRYQPLVPISGTNVYVVPGRAAFYEYLDQELAQKKKHGVSLGHARYAVQSRAQRY